jgi:endo-1,4-beta-D-glucanase Y
VGGDGPGAGGNTPGAGGEGPSAGGNDPGVGGGDLGAGGGEASGGGGSIIPGEWHGAVSTAAEAAAASEYQDWHAKYFTDCEDGTACIADGGRCVSEGIGYGMLAAVSADDQATFDKLWAYYLKYSNANGVMDWNIAACNGTVNNGGGTSDAELDAAYALLQAQWRWGSANYGADATTLITAVKDHETDTCSGRIILKPGDRWGGCNDGSGETRINPSYFAPAYYRAFALHVPDQAVHWNQMVTDTYDLFDLMQARMTGALIPDWCDADGADWYGASYGYESVRAPWRVAIDYGLTGDERPRTVLEKLITFVDGQGGPAGGPYDKNSAFHGSFTMPGLIDQAKLDSYFDAWMQSQMDDGPYYQATLRLLFIQAAGGQFYVP